MDHGLDTLIGAQIDNRRRERGSQLVLLAHISLTRRLAKAVALGWFSDDEFVTLVNTLTGYEAQDAWRLYKLDAVAQRVIDKCEADRALKAAAGLPYQYPDWRTALGWFEPDEDETAALQRKLVALEDEIADLQDQIVHPVPQRDSRRWFEQEVLAMTWGMFPVVAVTVADGQTRVEANAAERTIFLRAIIPRTFPGVTTMALSDIKRDRFDRASVRLAGGQAQIATIPWDYSLDLATAVAVLTRHKQAGDTKLVPATAFGANFPLSFKLTIIKWLLRKKPPVLRLSGKGVLGAEVVRNDITYEYFVRAMIT